MIPELTPQENAQFELLLSMAKKEAEPEAAKVKSAYIKKTAKQLEQQGLSPSDALAAAEMRCRRNGTATLHEKDLIQFKRAGMVPVRAVLADPTRYHLQSCADPVEPEEGTSKAVLYSNPDGSVILSSRLHGGQTFFLRRTVGGQDQEDFKITKETLLQHAYSMALEKTLTFKKMQPVLGSWLLSGSMNMIHGPAGKGKTWVVLGSGLSLATGVSFVPGWEVHSPPVKVLMVDGEMSPDQLRDRKFGLIDGCPGEIDPFRQENLVTISNIHLSASGFLFLDLSQPQDRKSIEDFILDENFQVVFLDNLSCLIPGINIKLSEEIAPFLMWLRSLIAQGVTVIFVHHDNKSDDFTGANEMTFPLQTRLHVRGDGSGFKVDYPKFRHGARPVSERFSIQSFHNGLAITKAGISTGGIIDDTVAFLVACNGKADRADVLDHLETMGHDRESAGRKIRSELSKTKGRFRSVENELTTL